MSETTRPNDRPIHESHATVALDPAKLILATAIAILTALAVHFTPV